MRSRSRRERSGGAAAGRSGLPATARVSATPRQYFEHAGCGRWPSSRSARSASALPRSDLLSTIAIPGSSRPAAPPGPSKREVEVARHPLAELRRGERDARVGDGQRGPQAAVRARSRRRGPGTRAGSAIAASESSWPSCAIRCLTVRPRRPLSLTSNANAPLSTVLARAALVAPPALLDVVAERAQLGRVEVRRAVGERAPAVDLERGVRAEQPRRRARRTPSSGTTYLTSTRSRSAAPASSRSSPIARERLSDQRRRRRHRATPPRRPSRTSRRVVSRT